MKKYAIILLLGAFLALSACGGSGLFSSPTTDGGNASVVESNKETKFDETGKPTSVTEHKIEGKMKQPDNPTGGMGFRLGKDKNGNATITAETDGGSQNNTKILAQFSLAKIVTFAGVAMVFAGLAVGYFTKNVKWALIVGLTGVGMAILAQVMVAYAGFFLLGILALAGYGAYLVRDYIRQRKAVEEQTVKSNLATVVADHGVNLTPELMKKIAEQVYSETTTKIEKAINKDA